MKRLVKLSDRFQGGKSFRDQFTGAISKMSSEGIFGMLLDSEEEGHVIRISIDCSSATADKTIALFAGALSSTTLLSSIAGVTADVIASNGTDSTNHITVNCPKLAYYQAEVAAVPTRIKQIQVEVDNATQLNNPIMIAGFGLTNKEGEVALDLTKYKNAKNSQSNLVIVDDLEFLALDRYKAMYLTVNSGRKVDISLTVGERFNPAKVLENLAACIVG